MAGYGAGVAGQALGIDIGGSGMKAAPVDVDRGVLVAPRKRIRTPRPANPEAVAAVAGQLVGHFDWDGPVGVALPAVVQHGIVRTAANIDPAWLGTDAVATFAEVARGPVTVVNDADAAGLAEANFGAASGHLGVVVVVTLGTGIGTALLSGGVLVPNSELGHLVVDGVEAEEQASDRARERDGLSWKKYGRQLGAYLRELERLLWPDLIVLGGGVSREAAEFVPHLGPLRARVVPAVLLNEAGIVGAALARLRA